MELNELETKMAVLIESIASLSRITANHDILLTKLVDDHESRIRLLERCSLASDAIPNMEKRIRAVENWRWWTIGLAAGVSAVITYISLTVGV